MKRKTERLEIRLTPDTKRHLQLLSAKEGISAAELISILINREFRDQVDIDFIIDNFNYSTY